MPAKPRSLGASASAPALRSHEPPTQERRLPLVVQEWATRCLDQEMAPLLAGLAWAQRGVEDPVEQQGWQSVAIECGKSGFPLVGPPEPPALEERELSRISDAALGAGPVTVALQPPDMTSSLASSSMEAEKPVKSTFGSSREETHVDPSYANSVQRRFGPHYLQIRPPGPGSYTPKQDGRTYSIEMGGLVHGATWGREDRQKHLGQSGPLTRCGPAPGFCTRARPRSTLTSPS